MRTTTALLLAAGATANVSVILMAFGLVLLLCAGVVLPAVWSSSPSRRRAAVELLRTMAVTVEPIDNIDARRAPRDIR